MKKPHLHSAGSIRFSASFINKMLLLCLLGIVMPQAIYWVRGKTLCITHRFSAV